MKLIFAVLILFPLILIGCVAFPYNKRGVKKYVKENISEYPCVVSDAEVSPEGYKTWTVYFEDKPDYKFKVVQRKDNLGATGIQVGWALSTDYDSKFAYYYLNEFKVNNKCELLFYHYFPVDAPYDKARVFDGFYHIQGKFDTMGEGEDLADCLTSYFEYINGQKYKIKKLNVSCFYKQSEYGNYMDEVIYAYENRNVIKEKLLGLMDKKINLAEENGKLIRKY